nr:lysozyme inhibitor LprI family protein [uncultured Rhodoferax sp.]
MKNKINRNTWFATLVFGYLLLVQPTQAASFDCSKGQSKVEQLICDNPEISKLDEELHASYQATLQNQANAAAIKQTQKQWLKERDRCVDVACVKSAYAKRLSYTSAPPTTSGYWDNQGPTNGAAKGKGYTVCDKVKNRLNAFTFPKDFSACSWRAIATMPGFTEPQWEDIDPKKHEALLYKLFKYRGMTPEDYFAGKSPKNEINPEVRIQEYMREFFGHSGRMRIWRTRLPLHEGGYKVQEVTFVQLAYKRNRAEEEATCKSFPFVEWAGSTFAVTEDLTGPDPRVDGYEKEVFAGDMRLYNGKVYFVDSVMGIEITTEVKDLILDNFCTIQYSKQGE